jgi:signal transduction histidine kinase
MWNWTRSLSGQLILILFSGVAATLILSASIHLQNRGETLFTVGGMQTAQRFANIVQMLEQIPVNQRNQVIKVLDSKSQFTRLLDSTPSAPRTTDQDDEHALYVQSQLRDFLGKERLLGVTVIDTIPEEDGVHNLDQTWLLKMMHKLHSRDRGIAQKVAPHGISYMAQIQLIDGQWIEFHSHIPEKILTIPKYFFPSLLLLVAMVTGLSFLAVRLITQPLRILAEAAEQFGRDIEGTPISESGSTELRTAARAFNAMQARLMRFIQERMHLLAAISHDLKTPLTRMKLRSEILHRAVPTLGKIYLNNISEMEEMVGSALDYIQGMERLEKKKLVYIQSILETLEMEYGEIGQDIQIECSQTEAFWVMPGSFKRCLSNLIQNAIKYGNRATIIATVQNNRLWISVTDDGPGIPEEEMEKVFEPFVRLETSRSRNTGGVGLGLSIARNIVRSHGGELTLKNRKEGGLEVILVLPTESRK